VVSIMPPNGRVLYMRSWMIGLVLGVTVATQLPLLVPGGLLLLAIPGLLVLKNQVGMFLLGMVMGCALVSVQGSNVLQDRLHGGCTGAKFELEGRVVSLPRTSMLDRDRRRQRFEFEVHSLSPGECGGPRHILLSWYGERDILPGQQWRFQARLRRPWGLANEGSFNIQGWYVLTGIDAVGSVRDKGAVLLDEAKGQWMNRWRYGISRAIGETDIGTHAGAVLRAVTVADKSGIDHSLWSLFQRLGINHLLVISGLHVGMVAGVGYMLGRGLGWCLRLAGLSGSNWGAFTSVGLAIVYTGLAGFSVATQRALFMLMCFLLAGVFRRGMQGSDKLLLAAVLVVLINPLAPLGSGFWLSFSAVAALLWLSHWQRARGKIGSALVAHLYMGLLMLPMGGFWFGASSWLSAPANLLMVPLVGLYVVPLSLLGVLLLALNLPGSTGLWQLAAVPLELLFEHSTGPLDDVGLLPLYAIPSSALLAALGLTLLLIPGNVLRKLLLVVLWLPLLTPTKNSPQAPVLNVLDVGQGTAVIFRAGGRVLLYDTGGGSPSGVNLAQSVVLPFLRSQGVDEIDILVVSHGDLDHSAGVHTILAAMPVGTLWVGGGQEATPSSRPCRAGIAWRWDEHATFQFLSPATVEGLSDNDASCVLAIESDGHRLLLAGDIEKLQEQRLISYWQGELASDFLLVAHHGSQTSTTQSWLNHVDPQIAVINNAYGNHFGHPAPVVVERIEGQGVRVFHTASAGALEVGLDPSGEWSVAGRRQGIKPWWM